MILLCKLLLAPTFVVAITLAVRRFGPRVGGLLGGLPVVAGPILLIYALDHGTHFAAEAAGNSLAALVALTTFVMVVALGSPRLARGAAAAAGSSVAGAQPGGASSRRARAGGPSSRRAGAGGASSGRVAVASVVAGWIAFCSVAAVLAALDVPPIVGLGLSCAAFLMALVALPHADPDAVAAAPQRPPFDLGVRAASAAVLVILLTSLSGQLGPGASGVLAPFPTITSVLAGFAVAHKTRATTLHLLRGMLRGFFSFATALFVLAVTLEPFGTALAFLTATAATAAVQLVLLALLSRGTQPSRAAARAAESAQAAPNAAPAAQEAASAAQDAASAAQDAASAAQDAASAAQEAASAAQEAASAASAAQDTAWAKQREVPAAPA